MRRTVGSAIVLAALLAVAWLLWSGIYKPLLLGLGVFSVALSVYLAYRVGFFHRPTGLHVMLKLPRSHQLQHHVRQRRLGDLLR